MPEVFIAHHPKHPSKESSLLSPMTGMFSSFVKAPNGIRFETQDVKEEIILLLRQHFVVNISWILMTLGLIFLPFLVLLFLAQMTTLLSIIPSAYYVVLFFAWYTGVFGFVLLHFMQWYFNIYIVTNERIVDIDFNSLLFKTISSAELSKIEDVTYKQGGFFSSFFDFGDVFVQTAGSVNNFEFESVESPDRVVQTISELTGR